MKPFKIFCFSFMVVANVACSSTKQVLMLSPDSNPVIAHRGAFKKEGHPQNSIASLQSAIRLGCAASEFDVWMTADDTLIINHDAHWGGKPVERSTYAELAQQKLSNGEQLPTLRNYLAAGAVTSEKTGFVLEIKPTGAGRERSDFIADAVVAMVKSMALDSVITYISFDYGTLQRVLRKSPGAKTQYLNGDKSPAELKAAGISGMDYNISVYRNNEQYIRQALDLGLQLNAWTVNNKRSMEWLLKRGFHSITTDEPEMLLELVGRKAR